LFDPRPLYHVLRGPSSKFPPVGVLLPREETR